VEEYNTGIEAELDLKAKGKFIQKIDFVVPLSYRRSSRSDQPTFEELTRGEQFAPLVQDHPQFRLINSEWFTWDRATSTYSPNRQQLKLHNALE
jgi:hypothetical protein